ncbi:MAG: hypothetical protein DWQ34_11965 [Planctomycetota bacterium]|nr:MAG: hypothetical protein DWQ29_22300 [Planctomycetota bacterium]REJ92911.1 MAG: hypothetical protein DWQ34_11965 [Planctomycetota bacterium]REK26161.1 MAG: hypothetical protein DWQ41_10930 [Planctomycetota bacterium]REK33530.1 MAG: hypothetical protein DWQ45_15195 [Planctomycetota bacterium]
MTGQSDDSKRSLDRIPLSEVEPYSEAVKCAATEARRRADEMRRGEVAGVPHEEVMKRLR